MIKLEIIKLLYKQVDLIAGMVGGLLAGLIFKRVWKLIGRGGAPKPTDERRGWGEILLAAMFRARSSRWSRPPSTRRRRGDAEAHRDLARR